MKHKVIKEFIPGELCQSLIDDYVAYTPSDAYRWHGGRKLIPNTSVEFKELISKSDDWAELSVLLSSQSFSEKIVNDLSIAYPNLKITRFFSNQALRLSKFRERASGMVRNCSPLFLCAWAFYSIFIRSVGRLYALLYKLRGCEVGEVFFDASSASNGYSREIHRDSDARVFVFLLYLNQLTETAGSKGGELCLHKFGEHVTDKLAQPDICDAPIDIRLAPTEGMLVCFENDEDAVHSVSEMIGFEGERYFIYGSLTLLSGRNKKLTRSKERLATDFRMYL